MRYVMQLAVVLIAVSVGAMAANAGAKGTLSVATGEPGSDSFAFVTELWAMSQIRLMPAHDIALQSREVATDEDRLSLLHEGEVEAAVIHGQVSAEHEDGLHTIMALWPRGISTDQDLPVRLMVREDVSAEVVYLLTKAMFEHANFFKDSHERLGFGHPSDAIKGIGLALHEGAHRYYREIGYSLDAASIAVAAQPSDEEGGAVANKPVAKVKVYQDFDDASLDQDEIDQVAAACRQAFEEGLLLAVLGDLERTGCEVYQDELSAQAKQPIKGAIAPVTSASAEGSKKIGLAGEELFESPVGQGGPAIRLEPTSDDTPHAAAKPSPSRVLRQPTM